MRLPVHIFISNETIDETHKYINHCETKQIFVYIQRKLNRIQIENKLIHFFATMGERLKKNKSIIAKEICDAMLAVESMPWSKKQSVSPSNVKFFNKLFEDKSDLVQRFADFADQLHWRQAGFGKLPENISAWTTLQKMINIKHINKGNKNVILSIS